MTRDERKLLERIAAIPAGEKLPVARFARELNCSQAVVIGMVQRLIAAGELDGETLRVSENVCARGPTATPRAAGLAVGRRIESAETPEQEAAVAPVSGPDLAGELIAFIAANPGWSRTKVSNTLFGAASGINSLGKAKRCTPETVDRVRLFIQSGGSTVVQSRRRGKAAPVAAAPLPVAPPSPPSLLPEAPNLDEQARIERIREIADEADAPHSQSAGDGVPAQRVDVFDSPSAVLRRAQQDWPDQCEAVKRIADEIGVTLGEAWRRVIAAGVDCMAEDEEHGGDPGPLADAIDAAVGSAMGLFSSPGRGRNFHTRKGART